MMNKIIKGVSRFPSFVDVDTVRFRSIHTNMKTAMALMPMIVEAKSDANHALAHFVQDIDVEFLKVTFDVFEMLDESISAFDSNSKVMAGLYLDFCNRLLKRSTANDASHDRKIMNLCIQGAIVEQVTGGERSSFDDEAEVVKPSRGRGVPNRVSNLDKMALYLSFEHKYVQ